VQLSTPLGYKYPRFFLDAIEENGKEVYVRLTAEGRNTLRGEITDDWEGDLYFPAVEALKPVQDSLTWIFTPCSREIDGETFHPWPRSRA
jgi:hypothetical protein